MLRPVISIDSTRVESFDAKDAMSSRKPSVQKNAATKDSEGLIPVISADFEIYYILDCPYLHVVGARYLFPEGNFLGENFGLVTLAKLGACPQCSGTFGKARKIPIDPAVLSFVPPFSSRRSSSEPNDHGPHSAEAPELVPEAEFDRHDSLPQIAALQTPRLPPSAFVSTTDIVSTDTSRQGSSLSLSQPSMWGFRWPRKGSHPRRRPLPTSLSFLFSATGHALLLWRRNGHSLVRIDIQSHQSQALPLLNAVPRTEGDREVNVKLVAEGHARIAVVLYHRQRFILLVTHASGSHSPPPLLPLPPDLRPLSLAMSRDNAYVAVGFGSLIHLYQYQGNSMVWGVSIPVAEFRTSQQVKYQILNFSPDSRYLIIATQKYDKFRGRDDDTVWVRVWRCEENAGEGTAMGDCQMPTDHLGVTSVFFDSTINKAFLGGFIDTPYPLFHNSSCDSGFPSPSNQHGSAEPAARMNNFKIRCAAQSPNPTDICFLTGSDKLYQVNLQSQAIALWQDLASLRGRLDPKDEQASICMPMEGLVYVAWKEESKLWLVQLNKDSSEVDKQDFRWLIDQSGWLEGA